MGRALITANIGAGLYRATPQYDFTRIDLELLALNAASDQYWVTINAALDSQRLIAADVDVAREALNAVVEQWRAALIDKLHTAPAVPPPVEIDPDTGAPWLDPDRAQDAPLLAAVNAARAAAGRSAVARNADLDQAALGYLRHQAGNGRTGHLDEAGRGPGFRANNAGYGYVEIGELLSYGQTSPGAAVALWARGGETRATLIDADFVDAGVAYVHGDGHYAAHLWCVLLAAPGALPDHVVGTDPAAEKARAKSEKLKKVTLPKLDDLSPGQLGKAAQEFGSAVARLREAEREIVRLQVESLERTRRIGALEAVKAAPGAMDVWCATYSNLMVGTTVDSIEVPGFWREEGTARTSVIFAETLQEQTVAWVERSWNIAPRGQMAEPAGQLVPADGVSDAAAFVNLALEPGHLKWMPRWRYAVITALAGSLADIEIAEDYVRPVSGETPLSLQRAYHYSGVAISYPPCGPSVFQVEDEVLVLFTGAALDVPVIVGFRREPRTCSEQISWGQIV